MADKSGWKHSERMAAGLFPGGRRRIRTGGGGDYALRADDVIWGPEGFQDSRAGRPSRIVKLAQGKVPAIYIEVKKKGVSAHAKEFFDEEKNYRRSPREHLVYILHLKGRKRQLVTVSDAFFKELLACWCERKGILNEKGVREISGRVF